MTELIAVIDRYQELLQKWIHIYAELLDEDKELEQRAGSIGLTFPFNYAKPKSVAAVCVWAAGRQLKKEIPPKKIVGVSAISMTTFQNIKNHLRKKGVVE